MDTFVERQLNKKTSGSSPELTASIFSIVTKHWLEPFVSLGNKRVLQEEDLYDLNPKETARYCVELWTDAKVKYKGNNSPSVCRLLWLCFGREYAVAAIFKPVMFIASILQVFILRALVEGVADAHNFKWWWGTLLVLGMFFMTCAVSISRNMEMSSTQKVGMKIRSVVSMIVFDKILSLKFVSLADTNSGLILNLVTNDTQKLLNAAFYSHHVWFALIELSTVSALAIIQIGASAIPGLAVIFLTQPLLVWMACIGGRLRTTSVKYTDSRVQLIGEIVNGIRAIKYNGWIAPFLHRIANLRCDEMKIIRKAAFVKSTSSIIRDCINPLASLASFGAYYAIHKSEFMTASQAFAVVALFGILFRTFSLSPTGVQAFAEAIVAIRRLQKLLDLDDFIDSTIEEHNSLVSKDNPDKAVVTVDCYFTWEPSLTKGSGKSGNSNVQIDLVCNPSSKGEESLALQNINFCARKGELVSIQGPVGSGKSSLLQGILGEMQCLKGSMFVQRNVAYVSQQPWILNDTIRRNIIYTSSFDPERYLKVVAACALEHDISQFPGGHDTEIGFKGINFSGGQKARISLARACYSSAPVIFLDDPFAAVDAPTGKHLIDHVLKGIIKGRTLILITHNKAALGVCDHMYYMEKGCLSKPSEKQNHDTLQRDASAASVFVNYTAKDEANAPVHVDSNDGNKSKDNDEVGSSEKEKNNAQISELEQHQERGILTVKEERVEGKLQLSTWITYAKASGGPCFFSVIILIFMIAQALRVMGDYWLRIWTDKKYHLKPEIYLVAYASFAVGTTVFCIARGLVFTHAAMTAATNLHSQMAEGVLRSPQLFFDQNVAGRILNRFGKDQSTVDEMFPYQAQTMFEFVLASLGTLIFIGVLIPWFLLAALFILFTFFYLQRRYVVLSRELKRLEGVSRSPLYAHFTQTLQGVVSVRAYGAQVDMRKVFMALIDGNHRSFILFVHMSRWLSIRMEFVTSIYAGLVSAIVVALKDSISPGLAGVILVQSMQLTLSLQLAIREMAETENQLTSVERIDAYAKLSSEADPKTQPGVIDTSWPSRGEIEFQNYTLTYRVESPPVLNSISFKVYASEKLAVLGRTGVGKSSLAAALFRMVENSGCSGDILIDGVNIKLVGLDDLRQRLSIIPQDPVLFQGSLRFNLDPFGTYCDADMYEELSRVNLIEKIESLNRGLDSLITPNGENFSVGERQLVCLARSILRRSQVIVMDEATAAIDGETDNLIQATIRTVFREQTVLTIAHRIDSVIDCDRVLVLATGGRIAELDFPSNLLQENRGVFAEIVRQTGSETSQRLSEAADKARRKRIESERDF